MNTNRFNQLLESTMGNVKPLINESPDPTFDFILTKDEMTCLNPRYKEHSFWKERYWIVDKEKQKLLLGTLNQQGYFTPYCTYDINNRPLNPKRDEGWFEYTPTTGVISFATN